MSGVETLRAQPLMGPRALLYFYRRRLRVHAVQELLAGAGVAVSVALVFATIVASGSIAGSAGEVVRTVVGPATLQLLARGSGGFDEATLARVEHLPGVEQAAPLLEQTATLVSPRTGNGTGGHLVTVDLAGADTSLVVLDGLAHTLPTKTLSAGGIGLSRQTAEALGIPARAVPGTRGLSALGASISLRLRGRAERLKVSAVLGPESFGALSQAQVAVMSLTELQRLAGLDRRVSRVLVQAKPGRQAAVRAELEKLAAGRLSVASAEQDVALLNQALRPSNQASALFATVSALLGLLLAGSALLLTVPERRRAIADLRLIGAKRSAIAQMFLFQALILGTLASLVGLAGGYALSQGIFHQSARYLAEAFTLGTRTVLGARPVAIAFAGGVLATCTVSALPLLDLRRGKALDAVYRTEGVPGNALAATVQRALALAAGGLLATATVLFFAAPDRALIACVLLAFATVLAVPLAFAGVLRTAEALAEHRQTLTILPVALAALRATTLRSLALAATGAVALFGSVALGGARSDLLRGIEGFAHDYSADAPIWVGNDGDNQAAVDFRPGDLARRIAHVKGVAGVSAFQGSFLTLDGRRVWVLARPVGGARNVLAGEILQGNPATAQRRLAEGGWIVVSRQIAEQLHVGVGARLTLPTPSGLERPRIAATTTNLAWSPGVVFVGTGDYRRMWASALPSAFAVALEPGASTTAVSRSIRALLGPASDLSVTTARAREASIDALTGEGLDQLREISLLLLASAILAMAAALTSAIWSRRASLAGLRLAGVRPARLRAILLYESALMLGAGCVTGALAGIYGQFVIDRYLERVTGFPVASLGASLRPLEIFVLVLVLVMAIVAIPGYVASRVSPTLAFNE
ncbi:MAG TPA: FtsX-like permease family protein [Solirubrobacteraceae bacterium]|nr:FtsX-like permease family protein [Solirubrobacteraceae bacterium]